MSILENLIKLITLDYSNYPNINLKNKNVVKSQFENIRKFAPRRNALNFSTAVLILEILLFEFFANYFDLSHKTGAHITFQLAFLCLSGILIVIFMLRLRCPKCRAIPYGRHISLTGGVSYTKGVNPFPSRCACCGFYLREGALRRDLKRCLRQKEKTLFTLNSTDDATQSGKKQHRKKSEF
nr:hypothetical protein [uncultured Undibacterium sp.]